MKIVVIGGGAGGASFAARMRRLDNKAEITILEKTDETSIASCGLPYFIGNIIEDRSNMQVASPAFLKQLFDIDVVLNAEVCLINPQEKFVQTTDGRNFAYDKLILATGTKPFIPPLEGLDNMPHFTVKSLADADKIKAYIAQNKPQRATVIGGGFIGVEVAENLCHLGIKTALVEMADQVLLPLDTDLAVQVHKEMTKNGMELYLKDGLKQVEKNKLLLTSGKEIASDMLILAAGVRPETSLAEKAGIKLTDKGLIITNAYMQTNFSDIYALLAATMWRSKILFPDSLV